MATTSQKSIEEPLLSGASDENSQDAERAMEPRDEEVVVRVVINPSTLDRFFCSDYYYFYDDIPVPYQTLLIGAEQKLLPSQKKKLLLAERGESSESKMFGHLWMGLCARLAKTQAEYYQHEQSRLWCLGLLWSLPAVFSVLQIGIGNSEEFPGDSFLYWLLIVAPLAFVLYPITIRFKDVTEKEAQKIVDDMGPLFSDEGFHVDLITSSPVMYIRFQKAPSKTSKSFGSSSSLKETMTRFQIQAQHDHQEALVAQRQEKLKTSRSSEQMFFGIRNDTIESWQSRIKFIAFGGAVIWMVLQPRPPIFSLSLCGVFIIKVIITRRKQKEKK